MMTLSYDLILADFVSFVKSHFDWVVSVLVCPSGASLRCLRVAATFRIMSPFESHPERGCVPNFGDLGQTPWTLAG